MEVPPMRLMIDKNAEPVAHHIPIPVPLHWQDKVKAGLDQDVALGVIEPVPVGEPVTWWYHRMVICAKKNGQPQRTVDFQALNLPVHKSSPCHSLEIGLPFLHKMPPPCGMPTPTHIPLTSPPNTTHQSDDAQPAPSTPPPMPTPTTIPNLPTWPTEQNLSQDPTPPSPKAKKQPLALRRRMDFNKKGLLES